MVITKELEKVLTSLGAVSRDFEWLQLPAHRTKGAITFKILFELEQEVMPRLREVCYYSFKSTEALGSISDGEQKSRTVRYLAVCIEVDVPFQRGRYQTSDGQQEHLAVMRLSNTPHHVVVTRNDQSVHGVMLYEDWVEGIMKGEIKLIALG